MQQRVAPTPPQRAPHEQDVVLLGPRHRAGVRAAAAEQLFNAPRSAPRPPGQVRALPRSDGRRVLQRPRGVDRRDDALALKPRRVLQQHAGGRGEAQRCQ